MLRGHNGQSRCEAHLPLGPPALSPGVLLLTDSECLQGLSFVAAPSTGHRHHSSSSSTCSVASASAASIAASGSGEAEAKMTLARDHPRLVSDVIDGMRAMSSGGAYAAADGAAAAGRRPPPATLQIGGGYLSTCRVPVIWAGLPPMAQLQSFPRRHRKARHSSTAAIAERDQ